MKLAIMTKSAYFVEEDKILAALFEEGMENLHLYKPGSSPLYAERLLSLLPDEYYRRITAHDHFYLKDEYGLAGIHLDDPTAEVPLGYKGRVGRTCTDLSTLKDLKKRSNYVILKNLFDSQELKEEKSNFTLNQLEEASRQGLIDRHVFALGGMSIDNVRLAKDLGFGGIIIRGDLWNCFDIHNETDFKELIAHFNRLRKAVG
ncbi:MAG: thiamine phosphate synthase [Prevotella sp.]|nr:thiamine phosphate synthase [Prevotella sp.]